MSLRQFETPLAFGGLIAAMGLAQAGHISQMALDTVFAVILGLSVARAAPQFGLTVKVAWLAGAAIAFCAIGSQALVPHLRYTPFLGILLIHLAVGAVFLRGIMPGRTPILLQFVALMGRGNQGGPAFKRFMRRQCWLWAGFAFLTAGLAGWAMLSATSRGTAGACTTAMMLFQVLWFVASHYYAQRRYARPESWHHTLAALSRPAAWSRLEI